ncbi:UNVERIFIED_CONTAM: Alpha carbonic anhydrase 7 [Sesamum indicum]
MLHADDERQFSYEEDSEIGPSNWGKIRPEWSQCNSGRLQSPIDLLNQRVEEVSHLGRLKRNYNPSNATLINRGHDMMLRWRNDAGHIQINGTLYHLRQCHWHSPSEHTINGKRFDMETHLVHESDDKRTAVIGIMYKIGRPDAFLSMLKRDFEAIVETRDVERTVGVVNPKLVELGSRKYYRYMGSLTVPPCTQDIIWTMVKKVRTVTREQVELIREAVHDESEMNARPIQPMNERPINLYTPKDREN